MPSVNKDILINYIKYITTLLNYKIHNRKSHNKQHTPYILNIWTLHYNNTSKSHKHPAIHINSSTNNHLI